MKVQELRIGNLVTVFEDKIQIKVEYLSKDCVCIEEPNEVYGQNEFALDKVNPIPLTEEWLLKFGFNGRDYGKYSLIKGMFFDWQNGLDSEPLAKNIKHVHQLQNLYFALTQTELTIKQ